MTPKIKRAGAAAITLLAVGLTAPTLAQAGSNDDPAEAKAFLASGMTIADAVSAAEAKVGGTAMSASWEPQNAQTMGFEVELAKADGTVTTVTVDPRSGSVTAAAARSDEGMEDDDHDRGRYEDDDEDGDRD